MALKVKAKEKLIKVGKYADTFRFVLSPELYIALTQNKVIAEAALRSGVSKGVMQACWDAAGEVIKAWATEGHSVALPGLGTMRFGMNAKTCGTVEEVKSSLITTRKVVFTPNVELKQELKNTSVKISCYDKDGNLITTVTSDDEGNVEDENENGGGTNDNVNANDNENGGTNTGDNNQGGGTNQGGGSNDNGGDNNGGGNSSGVEEG